MKFPSVLRLFICAETLTFRGVTVVGGARLNENDDVGCSRMFRSRLAIAVVAVISKITNDKQTRD